MKLALGAFQSKLYDPSSLGVPRSLISEQCRTGFILEVGDLLGVSMEPTESQRAIMDKGWSGVSLS